MFTETLLLLSFGTLGIFLGAQLTEAVLFVPYWKSLSADDFFKDHQTQGKKIYQFFAPLTIIATIIPLVTVSYGLINTSEKPFIFILMGMSTLLFFSTYFLYFKKANQSFSERSLSNAELPAELIKWGNWHWGRIFFEFIAFITALILLFHF